MPINSFLYPGAKVTTGFEVANSLRFERSSSDYLSKTFGSGGNRKTATQSFWMKRSLLSTNMMAGLTTTASGSYYGIQIMTDDVLDIYLYYSGSAWEGRLKTNRVFRDTNAWYHFVLAWDTTQSTASNRFKLYVNGVQETSFQVETYPNQNQDLDWNNNIAHQIMSGGGGTFSGYLAEFVFIDGQALDPTSFGEFDEDSPNIWKPKDVSGLTFGNNGFYLDFENSGSLGADVSGNGNNFTVNNLTSIDQSTDTCTNNFATLNPIYATGDFTFTEGNLQVDDKTTSNDKSTISTIGFNQGKWYLEFKIIDQGSRGYLGFTDGADRGLAEGNIRSSPAKWGMYMPAFSSSSDTSGTVNSNLGTATDNDIICFAFDADNGQLFMSKNGNIDTSSTATITGITTGNNFHFFINETASNADVSGYSINFGNPAYSISSGNSDANGYGNFEYSVPSGYYALNSKNLAEFG